MSVYRMGSLRIIDLTKHLDPAKEDEGVICSGLTREGLYRIIIQLLIS